MSTSIPVAQKLKSLETQKTKVAAEVEILRQERNRAARECSKKEGELKNIDNRIKELCANSNDSRPIVTEHALLRFFQRVLGFDLNLIATQILPSEATKTVKMLGPGRYPIQRNDGGAHYIQVKDGKVITIELD